MYSWMKFSRSSTPASVLGSNDSGCGWIKALLVLVCAMLVACNRDIEQGETIIEDPNISGVEQLVKYLDTAADSGAVVVRINGHVWRYEEPFHHDVEVDFDLPSTLSSSFSANSYDLRAFASRHRDRWLLIMPSSSTPLEQIWDLLDFAEQQGILYSLTRVSEGSSLTIKAAVQSPRAARKSVPDPVDGKGRKE